MPRQARLDAPGALHHIMVRGINKTVIFEDDQDKMRFLERFGQNVINGGCSVYAWVLMDNHVHILFKSGRHGISIVMRKLLTWYAQYFNRRHRRTGHLFENRYKSILCDEESYLLTLVRYIHLNPVRGHIVATLKELDHYPWSGHKAVMANTKHAWMDTSYILSQFALSQKTARDAYYRFMAEGLNLGKSPELTGGGLIRSKGGWSHVVSARRSGLEEKFDERILGNGDFVGAVLKEAEAKMKRQLKVRRTGRSITNIIEEECKKGQISKKELTGGSRRRKVSTLRAVIAKRSLDELGISMAEVARHVGVTTSCVAKAVARSEEEG